MKLRILCLLSGLMFGAQLQAAASSTPSELTREVDALTYFIAVQDYASALSSAYKALELFPEDCQDTMKTVIGHLHLRQPDHGMPLQHNGLSRHELAEGWFKQAALSDFALPSVRAAAEQGLRQVLDLKIQDQRAKRVRAITERVARVEEHVAKRQRPRNAVLAPCACEACGFVCKNPQGLAIHKSLKGH